jgi:hypothetical protein
VTCSTSTAETVPGPLTGEQLHRKYTAIKHAQCHDTSVAWWDCPTCRARLGEFEMSLDMAKLHELADEFGF